MKKILAFLTSLIFYLCFGCSLVIFHLIQWIALNLFGYRAHKFTIELLNRILLLWMKILGTKISFEITTALPEDRPLIFVANHQSTYDIPPLIWHLRKYHPKFISKIELGKGIPSVSFNLRHGGSVLIDRKKPKEALQKIKAFGKTINKKKYSAVIFPEGTRSKDGSTRKFQKSRAFLKNDTACSLAVLLRGWILRSPVGRYWQQLRFSHHLLSCHVRGSSMIAP